MVHDRDVNAAANIKIEALRIFEETTTGAARYLHQTAFGAVQVSTALPKGIHLRWGQSAQYQRLHGIRPSLDGNLGDPWDKCG